MRNNINRKLVFQVNLHITFFLLLLPVFSCKKLVEIDSPSNSITTSKIFKDSANAATAIAGIYSKLVNSEIGFGNGQITVAAALYTDELNTITEPSNPYYELQLGVSTPFNNVVSHLWIMAYSIIYQANACIEGLTSSQNINEQYKKQLIGEARFVRAWVYFYLLNLFGDVPLVTSTDWKVNQSLSRTQGQIIIEYLVKELKEAKLFMTYGYSLSKGERTRATSWAATALLAKIYLYNKSWKEAEEESGNLINEPQFQLNPNLNNVFLRNNQEAILQWQISIYTNLTAEGNTLIPLRGSTPRYRLSSELLNDFDSGDNRKLSWIKSILFEDSTYYYPYKYKNGPRQFDPTQQATEYCMVVRLGEQFLIRSEARGQQGKVIEALDDLNRIRTRSGLPELANSISKEELLTRILNERRKELAFEFGNRFFDIKRAGVIDSVQGKLKPQWKSFRSVFPIPMSEIMRNPRLTQNNGY